jgi:hypothetical protein
MMSIKCNKKNQQIYSFTQMLMISSSQTFLWTWLELYFTSNDEDLGQMEHAGRQHLPHL